MLKLGKESLIYGLSSVVSRLLNFLLVPFYSYLLITGDYGTVATVFSYLALFNIIYQHGMDQAYMRYAAGDKVNDKTTFSMPYFSVMAVSVTFSLLLILTAGPTAKLMGIGEHGALLVIMSACILALDALCIVPFAKLRLLHKPWIYVGIRSFSIILTVALNIIFLKYYGFGVQGVFFATLIASAATFVLLMPVTLPSLTFKLNLSLFKDMFKFAWPLVPAGLSAVMVQVIDRPLLLYLTDSSTVGVYQANYRMGIFMMMIVTMFDQAWRPFFLERAKKDNAKHIFSAVLTYFFMFTLWICAGLSYFLADIITVPLFGYTLLNSAYWGGLTIIPVILTAYLFHGLYINFIVAPVISKKTVMLMWITFAGAAANVAANLILVPRFNMQGAAWATLISYGLMALLLFIFGQKAYKISYDYKRLTKLAFIGVFFIIAYKLLTVFTTSYSMLITLKAALIIMYPVFLYITGFFTNAEIAFVKRKLSKR